MGRTEMINYIKEKEKYKEFIQNSPMNDQRKFIDFFTYFTIGSVYKIKKGWSSTLTKGTEGINVRHKPGELVVATETLMTKNFASNRVKVYYPEYSFITFIWINSQVANNVDDYLIKINDD